MTKGTFSAAIDKIDLAYVSESLNYFAKNEKTNIKRSTIFKIASVAACFAIVLVSVLAITMRQAPGNIDNPIILPGDPIAFQFNEDNGEPTVSSRCLSKTQSYFKHGDKISINASIGDSYTSNALDIYNVLPTYNNADKIGYPVFYVLDVKNEMDNLGDNYGLKNARDDSKMIINGSVGYYEKVFSANDMKDLDILDYHDASDYHGERIDIDYEGYSEGDHGVLFVGFGWWFTDYNPYSPDKANGSLASFDNLLFYYVGKTGIGLSYNSWEEAELNLEKNGEIQQIFNDSDCSEEKVYAIYQNITKDFLHGSIITCRYKLISLLDQTNYHISITGDKGINIVSPASFDLSFDRETFIEMQFQTDNEFDIGKINISVDEIAEDDDNSHCCEMSIYCLHNDQYDHISFNSFDELAKYSEKLATRIREEDQAGETSFLEHNTGTRYVPSFDVCGYIRWTASDGTTHPARNAVVEIRGTNGSTSSSWILDTVTTNDSGYYSSTLLCSGGSGDNVFIRVKSKGLNITVKDESGTEYKYDSNIYYGLSDGDSRTISYTANNSSDLGKSLGVHQGFELGNRYIYSLENSYLSNIDISYPDSSKGTSCYVSSENKIYILPARAFAWDVLLHEYGHYVQHCYGIENSPGGSHSSSNNLADTLHNKSQGIRLAWGEGWATYFSINSQNKMNASSMNIPTVGDTYYNNLSGINYDIEILPSGKIKGEANEATVAATLYDITDGYSTSDYDNTYCSNSNIWNITKNNNCTTLSEFITAFYNSGFTIQVKLGLGTTLSHHQIAAQLFSPSGLNTNTPMFTWDAQGGSVNYPNNSFKLVFYNSSYGYITTIDCGNMTSVTLTANKWNEIKSTGSTVYCYIETRQTSAVPHTGPYYSNLITINIP